MSKTPTYLEHDDGSPFPVKLSAQYLKKANELGIQASDIEEKFIKSSGPGGQNVNKLETCVCLKYTPTNISVKMQKHRGRERNRLEAYKLLIDKIEQDMRGKQSKLEQKKFKIRKQKQRRSRRAKEKMLVEKKRRAGIKELRKPIRDPDDKN